MIWNKSLWGWTSFTPDLLGHNCSTVWYFNKCIITNALIVVIFLRNISHNFYEEKWNDHLNILSAFIEAFHNFFTFVFIFFNVFLYKNNEWLLHTKIRFFYKKSLPKSTEDNDKINIDTLPLRLLLPSWNKVIIKINLGKRNK